MANSLRLLLLIRSVSFAPSNCCSTWRLYAELETTLPAAFKEREIENKEKLKKVYHGVREQVAMCRVCALMHTTTSLTKERKKKFRIFSPQTYPAWTSCTVHWENKYGMYKQRMTGNVVRVYKHLTRWSQIYAKPLQTTLASHKRLALQRIPLLGGRRKNRK